MQIHLDRRPEDRTIGVALLLPVGAHLERKGQDGLAHLIEHLLFKRTPSKPPEVLRRLENDAGFVDAFTDRDHTGFLCRTVPEDLEKTLDYLLDVVFRGTFTDSELRKEREVVLQEISEDADDPWAIAYDAYARKAFGRYGRPVGGSPKFLKRLRPAEVRSFVAAHYAPVQAHLALAGNLPSRGRIERIVAKYERLGRRGESGREIGGFADFSPLPRYWSPRRGYRMGYLCWGFPFRELTVKDLLILRAFAATTGDGPSSILWRELREKRSLVYDFSSGVDRYRHAVSCHFALATRPGKVRECLRVLESVLVDWRRGKIPLKDVAIGLKMVRRAELSRGEDPVDWAASVAYGGIAGLPPERLLREAESLTPQEVIARISGGLLPVPVSGRT